MKFCRGRATRRATGWGAAFGLGAAMAALAGSSRAAADHPRWGAAYFPNVTLTTHHGARVRFYDDLLKGKIVAINLIYTTCEYACPLETARLAQVQRLLGDRMGRDVFFYSITIDPEHDTPAVLGAYADRYRAGPGWLFLTGTRADIDAIGRKLGLSAPANPSNRDGHSPSLVVGNEATAQWMRSSALGNAASLARTIADWLNSWQTRKTGDLKSYAEAPPISFDRGEHAFAKSCAACHTIGRGDLIGPDLLDVTARRDRSWLQRFIVAPDAMNASGDPVARALRAKYRQARMPNLNVSAGDAALVIDYIEVQSRAVRAAAVSTGRARPDRAIAAPAVDPTPIVAAYLRIQQALSADHAERVPEDARTIAAEAAKLGRRGASIQTAAGMLRQAVGVEGARAVLGELSEAIIVHIKQPDGSLGEGVEVGYCPMVRKFWLQTGQAVQNPYFGTAMPACGRILPETSPLKQ